MTTEDMIIPMLTNMREDMNARFDSLDRRFDSLEGRVEHLEHHAVVTNSKLDAIYARQQSLEVVRDETWAQVSANATFASRFEQRYASDLAEIRTRLDRLESKDPPTRP